MTLEEAARWIRDGGVVVFPTETFYGLAVNPASSEAVRALFDVKGREAHVAVPLIASSMASVREWCGAMSPLTERLATAFWPGPLTLVLDAPAGIAADVHGGLGTIAVRVPSNAVACELAERCGGLITSTSANRSGTPPATTVAEVGVLLTDPRVRAIDAGRTPGGRPSTIVDARGAAPALVREGAITWSHVLKSIDK